MVSADQLILCFQAFKTKDTFSESLVESILEVWTFKYLHSVVQVLTFVIQAAQPMQSGGSSPNGTEPDTAYRMEVHELPTTRTTTNVLRADAENEGGNELNEASPASKPADSETQDTAETEADHSTAAADSEDTTGLIEGTHSDTAVEKSQDAMPAAITPAHSDRAAWPDWMKKHLAYVEAAAISDDFKSLVQQYIKLEASLGFPKGQVRSDAYRD